jgi:hypothetical protein
VPSFGKNVGHGYELFQLNTLGGFNKNCSGPPRKGHSKRDIKIIWNSFFFSPNFVLWSSCITTRKYKLVSFSFDLCQVILTHNLYGLDEMWIIVIIPCIKNSMTAFSFVHARKSVHFHESFHYLESTYFVIINCSDIFDIFDISKWGGGYFKLWASKLQRQVKSFFVPSNLTRFFARYIPQCMQSFAIRISVFSLKKILQRQDKIRRPQ